MVPYYQSQVGLRSRAQTRSTSSRSDLTKPSPELLEALGVASSSNGAVRVNENTAMRISAVFACVRVLAESVAQLPLKLYQKTDAGPIEVTDHPAAQLLSMEPNGWQTAFEFREWVQAMLALRGNAYVLVVRNEAYEPVTLVPVHPDKVQVVKHRNGVSYLIDGKSYSRYEVLHYRGLSSDGYVGDSTIKLMANAMSLAATLEKASLQLFANGARPSGALEHPQSLSEEAAKRLKESFVAGNAGVSNTAGVLVLEEGMKWQQIGLTFEDAQLLESKKFSVEEIARAYRVPLFMLQSTEKSTSWGTGIEQQTIGFIQFTLASWLKRTESTNNVVLLTEQQKRQGFYFKHNLNGLMRGDFKTRMEGYQIGLLNGIYNINEVREFEEMKQIDKVVGSIHRVPANTVPAGADSNKDKPDNNADDQQ